LQLKKLKDVRTTRKRKKKKQKLQNLKKRNNDRRHGIIDHYLFFYMKTRMMHFATGPTHEYAAGILA